ncbi:MAG: response regulator receiver protein [Micavibrio sp.]|nr:response regulator receiver protein [Micavibrio sp.]
MTLKILYIEDEPDIRALAEMMMQSLGGYTVKSCADGLSALEEAAGFQPDVIVLDVMMPGLSGPETLAKLRALPATASTPAIFMTGKSQAHEIESLIALGAIGVIQKPFDPMSVAAKIQELMDQA